MRTAPWFLLLFVACGSPGSGAELPPQGLPEAGAVVPTPAPSLETAQAAPAPLSEPSSSAVLGPLSDGVAERFPRRVKLASGTGASARRGGPEGGELEPGRDGSDFIVVEEAPDALRIVEEGPYFRSMLWVDRAEAMTVAVSRATLRPTQGGGATPGSVTVMPGFAVEVVERSEGSLRVKRDLRLTTFRNGRQTGLLRLDGWLDESQVGEVFVPEEEPLSRRGTHFVLDEPIAFLASPQEATVLARLEGASQGRVLVDVHGVIEEGAFHQLVSFIGAGFHIRGYVPRRQLHRPPSAREAFPIHVDLARSRPGPPDPERRLLDLPYGTCLYDEIGGEPVGVVRTSTCASGTPVNEGAGWRVSVTRGLDAAVVVPAEAVRVVESCSRSQLLSPGPLPLDGWRCGAPPLDTVEH